MLLSRSLKRSFLIADTRANVVNVNNVIINTISIGINWSVSVLLVLLVLFVLFLLGVLGVLSVLGVSSLLDVWITFAVDGVSIPPTSVISPKSVLSGDDFM